MGFLLKKFLIFLIFTTLVISSDDFQIDLMEDLNEISTIATKTKLNIDSMPSIVTILRGSELERIGISTVGEALTLIPGIDMSMRASGVKELYIRGADEKGRVKFIIDDMPVNNMYRESTYYYFNYPIEAIDRIEVIRGIGSALYGSNAFAGVIHIITKHNATYKEDSFYFSGGSYDYGKFGFLKKFDLNSVKITIDGYYQRDNKEILSGFDKASKYPDKYKTNAPGYSDESLRDYLFCLSIIYDKLKVNAQLKHSKEGDAFGGAGYLSAKRDMDGIINKSYFLEAIYEDYFLKRSNYQFKVGVQGYKENTEVRLYPLISGEDIIYSFGVNERSLVAEATLNYKEINYHDIIFGAQSIFSNGLGSSSYMYHEFTKENYYLYPNGPKRLVDKDILRKIHAIYLQDIYTLNSKLDISLGLRYDNYSDSGSALSPRVGAILKLNDRNSLKFMYGRAFRSPTFLELYAETDVSMPNKNLNPEIIDTFEIGYIYKKDIDNFFRANIYYSRVDDIIYKGVNTNGRYEQGGKNKSYGIEFEYKNRLNLKNSFYINYSYSIYKDENNENKEGIANHLANFWYDYTLFDNLNSNTRVQYVGTRDVKRALPHSVDKYITLNQTFRYIFDKDLIASFAIKNILDEDILYPDITGGYVNDFPREGRTIWLSFSKKF